ncbi:DNA-binding transcriptional regulator [Aggregatibacter actinomycetemcomitans]|uniref:helix-turn-helix domain-containing protein n=1 Tax=Aggregatibacter actinomycetemcomitans TaxID=714 RepID=UPI001F11A322|nr:DNA-binding transcriptional regulator [Aggregatibacter actinomycetemcomitans]MBN6069748.1 DNA-binding transcriptional regulator [Aggregatibacter actinomycetemcomitans]
MKHHKSEANAAIHSLMTDIHQSGLISKKTMRKFDKQCLTEIKPLAPEDIYHIRVKEQLSQMVFAHYLNVSKNLVSDWERGIKKPSGAALKLLTLVQHKGIEAIA